MTFLSTGGDEDNDDEDDGADFYDVSFFFWLLQTLTSDITLRASKQAAILHSFIHSFIHSISHPPAAAYDILLPACCYT